MKTYSKNLLIAATACIAMATGSTNAGVIVNVNFGSVGKINLEGPAGGSGQTWNQSLTTSDTDVMNASGGATTIDWSLAGIKNTGDWSGASLNLLQGASFVNSATPSTLTISGLDGSKTYDLYIASFDQNLWADGDMSFSTTNATTTVGAQVANANAGGPNWVMGDNYVLFENVTPDGSDSIVITGTRISGQYGFWSGFQLVEAVPEPATLGLLAIGGLMMIQRRRA